MWNYHSVKPNDFAMRSDLSSNLLNRQLQFDFKLWPSLSTTTGYLQSQLTGLLKENGLKKRRICQSWSCFLAIEGNYLLFGWEREKESLRPPGQNGGNKSNNNYPAPLQFIPKYLIITRFTWGLVRCHCKSFWQSHFARGPPSLRFVFRLSSE